MQVLALKDEKEKVKQSQSRSVTLPLDITSGAGSGASQFSGIEIKRCKDLHKKIIFFIFFIMECTLHCGFLKIRGDL